MILAMKVKGDGDEDTESENDGFRTIEPKDRWRIREFRVQFDGCGFTLVESTRPVIERVYDVIAANPGLSKNRVQQLARAEREAVFDAIEHLITVGRVEGHGDDGSSRLFAVEPSQVIACDSPAAPLGEDVGNRLWEPDAMGDAPSSPQGVHRGDNLSSPIAMAGSPTSEVDGASGPPPLFASEPGDAIWEEKL